MFDRRHERIETVQTKSDVELYDAAEVSYVAGAKGATRKSLATADFD